MLPKKDLYDDQLLLTQLSTGDVGAFKELFERYKKPFYIAALSMSGSHYLSEEVVQETFIKIWEKRSLLSAIDNPGGYLYTIFHRCLYQRYRDDAKFKRSQNAVLDMPQSDGLTPEEVYSLSTKLDAISTAIKQLPAQQAQVYKLIKEEGLSRERTAEKLGLSPNTVRNHLAEAIKTLRKIANHAGLLFSYIFFFQF